MKGSLLATIPFISHSLEHFCCRWCQRLVPPGSLGAGRRFFRGRRRVQEGRQRDTRTLSAHTAPYALYTN